MSEGRARTGRGGGWAGVSLRTRLMTIGVLGVTAALVLSGALLYLAVTRSVAATVDNQVGAIAAGVAALVDTGQLPDPIPQSGAQAVQVLDAGNRVVAASLTADRLVPLVSPAEQATLAAGSGPVTVPASRAAQRGELRVAGVSAGLGADRVLVVAALPTADAEQAVGSLRRLLLVAFPLFLLAMAVVAWRVIGGVLHPVEDLRAGAERIGADPAAPERLPVPAAGDEITALAVTLNSMLDRLAAAQRQQRAFVADAAHELRSPLATMRMQLDVAQHVGEGGSLPAELLPEITRLTVLVEDLLTLARAGGSPARPPEPVPLRPFLARVAERYAAARVPVLLAAGEGAAPEPQPGGQPAPAGGPAPGGEPTAYLASDDLVRAVTNLVDNAVRHAATRVELSCAATPSGVRLEVVDDGHGIPDADRERIFGRFARLDEGRARDAGGSGLGLPIARELMRRNGGEVTLEDAAPGVRAVVSLPAAPR